MKKFLLLIFSASFGFSAQAQDYAPFKMGRTPYFQAGDSIFSLRITNAFAQGNDSVFAFNPTVKRANWNTIITDCSGNTTTGASAVRSYNNRFGRKMLKNLAGEYRFVFTPADTFLLKPNAAVGESWTFWQQLTATLQSVAPQTIQGITDTVATIALSNGESIQIGQEYGLISARSFYSYLNTNLVQLPLSLSRLPEAGIGNGVNHPFKIYDFQPGDKFLHHREESSNSYDPCLEQWITTEVLSRNESTDSIWYQFKQQTLTQTHGVAGAPPGYCTLVGGLTLSAFDTVRFTVRAIQEQHLFDLSQEYAVRTPGMFTLSPNLGQFVSQYNSRFATAFNWMNQDTCLAAYFAMPDAEGYTEFAEGLGHIKSVSNNWTAQKYELIAYIKGAETYGNWQPLVLSAEEEVTQNPLQVFPNPFTSEITLQFPEATSEPAEITVFNLQGQRVHQQKLAGLPAQTGLKVALPSLPAGLYLLQVNQSGKSFSTKVQRQ